MHNSHKFLTIYLISTYLRKNESCDIPHDLKLLFLSLGNIKSMLIIILVLLWKDIKFTNKLYKCEKYIVSLFICKEGDINLILEHLGILQNPSFWINSFNKDNGIAPIMHNLSVIIF